MNTPLEKIRIGSILGLVGGVTCLIGMFIEFVPEEDNLSIIGFYLLMAVLFFALAGAFRPEGPWSWKMLNLLTFSTMSLAIVGVIAGYSNVYASAIMSIICVLIIVYLSFPSVKLWMEDIKN